MVAGACRRPRDSLLRIDQSEAGSDAASNTQRVICKGDFAMGVKCSAASQLHKR